MIAIECDSIVHNGCVTVPGDLEGRRVRMVVLADNTPADDRRAALRLALARRDMVPGFTPLSRDEANSR